MILTKLYCINSLHKKRLNWIILHFHREFFSTKFSSKMKGGCMSERYMLLFGLCCIVSLRIALFEFSGETLKNCFLVSKTFTLKNLNKSFYFLDFLLIFKEKNHTKVIVLLHLLFFLMYIKKFCHSQKISKNIQFVINIIINKILHIRCIYPKRKENYISFINIVVILISPLIWHDNIFKFLH